MTKVEFNSYAKRLRYGFNCIISVIHFTMQYYVNVIRYAAYAQLPILSMKRKHKNPFFYMKFIEQADTKYFTLNWKFPYNLFHYGNRSQVQH
jgi:hypothetical protein